MPLVFVVAQAGGQSAIDRFLGAMVGGLSLGAIYALLALGFVIIFKATQVLNFAHGAVSAMGAYLVVYFAVIINFPGRYLEMFPNWVGWLASAAVAIIVTAFVGLLLEVLFIRPMVGEPLFSIAIITLGIDAVLRTITNDLIGTDQVSLGQPLGIGTFEFGNVRVPHTQVATVVVAILALVALALFFKSRTGVAMRATAFDQESAMAQGINVGRIFALAWMIGAALAAIAGVFVSIFPRSAGVSFTTAFVALRALPIIVIGGLDSIVGAVVAGFAVGIFEVSAGVYLSQYSSVIGLGFSTIVPYLLMLAVLFVRPHGLFGTVEIRRV